MAPMVDDRQDGVTAAENLNSSPEMSRRAIVAGGLMAAGAGLAYIATPTKSEAPDRPRLEQTMPLAFADWRADLSVVPLLPDAATQATIDKVYDETLSRTYRNDRGVGVMLVIAYGSRQTESLQAHQPEVCYAAQGFKVEKRGELVFPGAMSAITAEQVYATMGARSEPILYWLCVGGQVTNFGMSLRWRVIKDGVLRNKIPEGFLVRASLIGEDSPESYQELEAFLISMLRALPPDLRRRLAGV